MQEPHTGIEKMPTGISGFDLITGGGLPRARTSLIMGTPGAGKTIFALQTLVNGARLYDEPGIFVTFEENSQKVIRNASSFGWELGSLPPDQLFFLDARFSPDLVASGSFDFRGLLAGLEAKAQQMNAKRIVFDSLDVLLNVLENRSAERKEAHRLHEWLSDSNLTGIITARMLGSDHDYAEEYGFMQFMVDCAVTLRRRIIEGVSTRRLRVVKYRGSDFAENEFPLLISPTGIDLSVKELGPPQYQASTERVSTGVARLDTMLQGGYFRGSSTLITGAPGTAKSTLAAAFALQACERGETVLYVSFDEASSEIIRNMRSVNIDFQPYVDSGQLIMDSIMSESKSPEEHLVHLRRLIETLQPACMVVDPISGLLQVGSSYMGIDAAQRLIYIAKHAGVTLLCTSLLASPSGALEGTPVSVSTIADTWLHLAYLIHGGERNRTLTIIKSRGTAHSNQVRELILSNDGISLADVYSAGGEVLLGTLRYEKEQEVQQIRERQRLEQEKRQRELQERSSELAAQIEALQQELEKIQRNLDSSAADYSDQSDSQDAITRHVQQLRRADQPSNNSQESE